MRGILRAMDFQGDRSCRESCWISLGTRMRESLLVLFIGFIAPFGATAGQSVQFMPVEDLKPGMKGVGKTVFQGTEVENFEVEVIGVVKNVRPNSDLILVKLSGGPLEESGMIAGMSGSPIYINGKLLGALAYGLGVFPKEPVGAVVPIKEILSAGTRGSVGMELPRLESYGNIVPVGTPVVFSGFDPRTIHWLGPRLEEFGFTPMAGGGGGDTESARLVPGSVLAVKLLDGDFDLSAVGTLTYLDGDRFYAWGHQLFLSGRTELPAAGGYVHTIFKGSMSSNKIVSPTKVLGAVLEDRLSGVSGSLKARPRMLPLSISVNSGGSVSNYNINVILNELLTPLLSATAVMNSVMMTGSRLGEVTIDALIRINLEGHDPIRARVMYSDSATTRTMANDFMALIGSLMGTGFEKVSFKKVEIDLSLIEERKTARIIGASVNKAVASPGDTLTVTIRMRPYLQEEYTKTVDLVIPEDIPRGEVSITIENGSSASASEIASNTFTVNPRNLDELLDRFDLLRPFNSIVVKMHAAGKTVSVPGGDMPSVPPSFLTVIGKAEPHRVWRASTAVRYEKLIETEELVRGGAALKVKVEER